MEAIIAIIILIVFIFVIRLFGAWMLRIDEVISIQKQILTELQKSNSEKNQKLETKIDSTTNKFCKKCNSLLNRNETKCIICGTNNE